MTDALLLPPSTTATGKILTPVVSCGADLQPGVKHYDCVGQLPGVNL